MPILLSMSAINHYDVIVVGVGSMGAAACRHIAAEGARVLGLDQFLPPHEQGSHAGQSRIIRKAYFEHADYVPLLTRAYQLWRELERTVDARLFYETGIVYFGDPSHATMQGIKKSSSLYHVPIDEIGKGESRERFPEFSIPENFQTLFEPEAGFVLPEETIKVYLDLAARSGADLHFNEAVQSWKYMDGHVIVDTDRHQYSCKKLVVTAGSWSSRLLPALNVNLQVTEQHLAWIKPKREKTFSMPLFPCWFVEDEVHGLFYGFPFVDGNQVPGTTGLKLANHRPGFAVDPARRMATDYRFTRKLIGSFLAQYFPTMEYDVVDMKSCLYTYSPDENFIIDFLPGYNNQVVVACGFSGHGFKFVPAVGEILSDLVIRGSTDLPIDFLKLTRFNR